MLLHVVAFVVALPAQVEPLPAIPASGLGGVPTNPLILVDGQRGFTLELVDDGGAIAPTTTTTVNGSAGQLQRVSVTSELLPQTRYTLQEVFDDAVPLVVTSFTTGDGADDVAPPAPEVTAEAIEGAQSAVLTIVAAADVDVVSVGQGGGSYFDVLDDGGDIIVSGQNDVTFSIVAVDHAGNPSAPTDIDVTFSDPAIAGCAALPPSTPGLLALALLLWRRRRI